MKKQLLAVVGLVLLGFPIALASADPLTPPPMDQRPRGDSRFNATREARAGRTEQGPQGLFAKLGLAPDKLVACQAISRDAHGQGKLLRTSLQQKQQALWDYVKSPEATQAQALVKAQEVAQLRSAMETHHIETTFKLKALMTPTQFAQFSALMKDERHQRMGNRG
jgi:Spy/CpxP family protein refolding chaperone